SCKTCLDILAEMNAQDAAVAFGKHLEVAPRLCGFDNAEGVFLPRHRNVRLIIASNLQEDAAVRPALVCLSCGMQEARAEAETSRNALAVANGVTQLLQLRLVGFVHLDVAEHGKVIARLDAVQVSFEIAGKRLIAGGGFRERSSVLRIREEL